ASQREQVVLIDASAMGTKIKEGKNQKTLLSRAEEQSIVDTFNAREVVEDFSVVVGCDDIAKKNYSLSAGQYFEVKVDYVAITPDQFAEKVKCYSETLQELFAESHKQEHAIGERLRGLIRG